MRPTSRRLIGNGVLMALVMALAIAGYAALSGLASPAEQRADNAYQPRVAVASLTQDRHRRQLRGHGSLRSRHDLRVIAEVADRLTADSPQWHSGDQIAAGATLLRLDGVSERAAVAQAEAEIARLQAEQEVLRRQQASDQDLLTIDREALTISQRLLENEEQSLERGSVAQRSVDQQRQAVIQARSQVAMREQALTLAEARSQVLSAQLAAAQARGQEAAERLGKTHIQAPFAGLVVGAGPSPGQAFAPGQEMLRLVTNREREVRALFTQQAVAQLVAETSLAAIASAELQASVTMAGSNQPRQATEVRLGGSVDDQLRSIELLVALESDEELAALPEGSFAQVTLYGPPLKGMRFPLSAVNDEGLWLLNERDELYRWQGEWVPLDADWALIPAASAPAEGTRLVVTTDPSLSAGMKVQPLAADHEATQQ